MVEIQISVQKFTHWGWDKMAADNIFKGIFLNKYMIQIWLKFVHLAQTDNK